MKKRHVLLSTLSSLLLLVGCGTKVSEDDAKKFVDENYKDVKLSDIYSGAKATSKVSIKTAENIIGVSASESSKTEDVTPTKVTSSTLGAYKVAFYAYAITGSKMNEDENSTTYTTSGKKLTINFKVDYGAYAKRLKKEDSSSKVEGSGTATGVVHINENGVTTDYKYSYDYTLNAGGVDLGILDVNTKTSKLVGTISASVELTKK